jgi:hypothetical protein
MLRSHRRCDAGLRVERSGMLMGGGKGRVSSLCVRIRVGRGVLRERDRGGEAASGVVGVDFDGAEVVEWEGLWVDARYCLDLEGVVLLQ